MKNESVMAVFMCGQCRTEIVRGYSRGHEENPPSFVCVECRAKTTHHFARYVMVDERSDAERARDKLRHLDEGAGEEKKSA